MPLVSKNLHVKRWFHITAWMNVYISVLCFHSVTLRCTVEQFCLGIVKCPVMMDDGSCEAALFRFRSALLYVHFLSCVRNNEIMANGRKTVNWLIFMTFYHHRGWRLFATFSLSFIVTCFLNEKQYWIPISCTPILQIKALFIFRVFRLFLSPVTEKSLECCVLNGVILQC